MKAVIMAGGRGTRLAPFTKVLPKPLIPLGDYPLLEIIICQLREAGFDEIILTVNYLAHLFQAYFGNGERQGVSLRYSLEEKPLGTAGPLSLIDGLDEAPFLVMNADLLTDDLKKKRASNESFWLIGQPDVQVERLSGDQAGQVRVSVHGFDYYNTRTGLIESGGPEQIAVWLLDTDYDGRSLFPRQVFFPMAGDKEGWARLARSLRAEIDPELIEAYRGTTSLPFAPGKHRRVAVKIVDDRGIESLKIVELD